MAPRAALASLVALGALPALAACDEVVARDYRGELTLGFATSVQWVVPPDADATSPTAVRLAATLLWGDADGAVVRVDPVYLDCRNRMDCVVEVYSLPPAAAVREAESGRFALGDIELFDDVDRDGRWQPPGPDVAGEPILGRVALALFSPDGASSPYFAAPMPAGMTLVDAVEPCAVAYPRFVAAPLDEARVARAHRTVLRTYADGEPHYFDPSCGARLAPFRDACPGLDATRYVCRQVAPASADPAVVAAAAETCARCLYLAFPPNADASACDEWRGRWNDHSFGFVAGHRLEEVLVEHRLCRAGEPPTADPCDHACACDARRDYCVEVDQQPVDECTTERDACLLL